MNVFSIDSPVVRDAGLLVPMPGGYLPHTYTTPKDELLACREGAWFGCTLNISPVYDISGPDVVKLMNYVSVNRDYAKLKVGGSRHTILCNDRGQMLADGVLMRREENLYRTYWLAPVLAYYVDCLGFDVKGEWVTDEFFFQLDGPRSLEIMEKASHEDLHDLKFAKHKDITVGDIPVTIHRLGMSGCLAYEMHGPWDRADDFYSAVMEAGKDYGIKSLGFAQYDVNHTQGGYPNQWIHFIYPYNTSGEEMAEYLKNCEEGAFEYVSSMNPCFGSAMEDPECIYATPYDVNWQYLINWDHEFIGKEALQEIDKDPPHTCVTLEWDAEDVGRVFASQFMGRDVIPSDDITATGDFSNLVVSKVLDSDGNMVGRANGRIHDYYHQRMISLAFIDPAQAELGNELTVIWGTDPASQMEIKATVAPFPYYNEEYRNETFDVEKIPHPVFDD